MSTIKHAAKSAENQPGTGRIVPLNMASGTNGLSYDSLLRDMTTAYDCNDESSLCLTHVSWA